ncbi:MAG: hypothetical protein ABSG14_00670 [Verrucomicrobiia bacterium]|jgi:hypothetical protein
MTNVIIEVHGGVVQNVAANRGDVRVVVIDWDDIECTPAEKYVPMLQSTGSVKSLTPETRRLYGRATDR